MNCGRLPKRVTTQVERKTRRGNSLRSFSKKAGFEDRTKYFWRASGNLGGVGRTVPRHYLLNGANEIIGR